MCGIAGIISFQGESDKLIRDISAMSKTIRHRGPDDEGYLVNVSGNLISFGGTDTPNEYFASSIPYAPNSIIENTSASFALLHRRLSIIDLSVTGHQPLCYQNRWITFNGEIYNYLELKEELEKCGHRFLSSSDTEVIIAAYIEWGEDCVKRFNGMWSFVIYSPASNTLFASRDRLGVKPFYFYNDQGIFSFASEQKAFLSTSFYSKEINLTAFIDYFVLDQYEQEQEGIYKGIQELFPGHNLSLNIANGELKIKRYYFQEINKEYEPYSAERFNHYKQQIEDTLSNAIKLRLRSDVEVGSCLSGGTDSSAIVGIASKQSEYKLNLFTASMSDKTIDESPYAKEVALQSQGKWFTVQPTVEMLLKDLNDLIYSQDIPIWSTSTYAQFSVMRLAKEHHTKVLLDGQGSDELFGGYPVHLVPYIADQFKNENIISFIRNLSNVKIPALIKRWLADFKLFILSPSLQLKILRKVHPEINALPLDLEPLILERLSHYRSVFFERTPTLNEYLFHETYNHRLKSYLKCEDRCSMWHSVESRTPFADDIQLINLAFSIPGNFKIRDANLKHLLKESVKDSIPESVYKRKDKMGYNTPNITWIRTISGKEEFFNAKNDVLNNRWIKSHLNSLLQSNNSRSFKLIVSAIWLK
jgi:asparagine synthase (glutamine-hydrolysing)